MPACWNRPLKPCHSDILYFNNDGGLNFTVSSIAQIRNKAKLPGGRWFGDASGSWCRDPRIARVGFGLLKMDANGIVTYVLYGPVVGMDQTTPVGELWALLLIVLLVNPEAAVY